VALRAQRVKRVAMQRVAMQHMVCPWFSA
jgi:hypothetical protein